MSTVDLVPALRSKAFSVLGTDGLLELSLTRPDRLVEPSAWVGHIPAAFWIVAAHRPRVFVELGTHSGNSYCAFCQAVALLHLPTACYAVDTWAGDDQAGLYDEEVYTEFSRYHDARYASFSRLVRSTFDQALTHIADGSVDLLHIDGYHTYDVVKHDFESWLPKLSSRGVVVLHDINVREREFGVWQLWLEVSDKRPHFAFLHHHGLGILGVGSDQTPAMCTLYESSASAAREASVRNWFSVVGRGLQAELDCVQASATAQHRVEAESMLHDVMRRRDELETLVQSVTAERDRLQVHMQSLRGEIEALTAANEMSERACALLRTEIAVSRATAERFPALERDYAAARSALARAEARIKRMRNSLLWKIGQPFRALSKRARGKR